MRVSREDIEHVAELARLHMEPEELDRMREHFESILGHFATLAEIPVEGVEPTCGPAQLVNVVRPDDVRPSLAREEVLRNAPAADGECFLVPLIMEED